MKVFVADVAFDNVTMAEAVVHVIQMAQKTDCPRYVCTGNMDHLSTIHRDARFRAIYDEADLVLADGAPVVWLSRMFGGTPLRERVTGSDLFWELARASAKTGVRLFFLGGIPGAANLAAEAVHKEFPTAQVCGTDSPSFTEFSTAEEQARIRAIVRAAQPDILLVGLGAPKQEMWIHANKDLLGVPVSIGVGGTFEMAGGVRRRAPLWMQQAGMEWIFRFAQEPRRLWRRYFGKDLPFFISLVLKSAFRGQPRRPATLLTKSDKEIQLHKIA
jgi:N-acetylglucosaminyldiphosphoundecaprenol N-acetyl-beta-D-mannosaminyltransferase